MAGVESFLSLLIDNWIILALGLISLALFRRPFNDLRHRYFAWFLCTMTKTKSERYNVIKKELFSTLHNIESKDPQIRKENAIKILEIGVGTGLNFEFYPNGTRLVVVDPNPHFDKYYNENRAKFPNIHSEEIIVCYGEDMDVIESNSIDAVVMTLVLCSVMDTEKVLAQIKRVLVPGGKFYFLEHVREFDSQKYRLRQLVQDLLTELRIWPTLLDGCCLNRETLEVVKNAGFSSVEGENFYAPIAGAHTRGVGAFIKYWMFKCVRPHAKGVATK
ncbi:unnamed protein product, partial [Meganyctiphanes norvegica]